MSIDINDAWEELKLKVKNCQKCGLCKTRKNTVFGEGRQDSKVVIIGEAPGFDEDATGKPFIGAAGKKLTEILEKGGGIKRSSLYIMNVIKCVPPDEEKTYKTVRAPNPAEVSSCSEYFFAQLLLLNPKVIVCLGGTAAKHLLGNSTKITSVRGQWQNYRGIELLPMYHPSYLFPRKEKSNEEIETIKRDTWSDVLSLRKKLTELNLTEYLM